MKNFYYGPSNKDCATLISKTLSCWDRTVRKRSAFIAILAFLSFTLANAQAPANDDLANAAAINCGDVVAGDTTNATLDEDDAPDGGADMDSPNVWYSFTSTNTQNVILSTCDDASFDTSILVYTGTSGNLTLVASNDDGSGCSDYTSLIGFPTDGSSTYYIAVEGYSASDTGTFNLTVTCEDVTFDCPDLVANYGDSCDDGDESTVNDVVTEDCECVGTLPPAGSTCDDSIIVDSLPYNTTDNTSLYGDDYSSDDVPAESSDAVGSPSSNYLGGDDVVYSYTPDSDGIIDVSVTNHDTWTGLFIFTGCAFEETVGGQTSSAASTELLVESLPVTAGETYYIVISTFPTPQSTDYTLSIIESGYDCPDLEADFGDACDDNDANTINDVINEDCECAGVEPVLGSVCQNSIEISSTPYTVSDNTENYGDDYSSDDVPPTTDDTVGDITGSYMGGDDVVYSYTPSENGFLNIDVTDQGTWTGFYVLSGCPFSVLVAGDRSTTAEPLSVADVPVEAGTTYYIVISTYPTPQSTAYTLSLDFTTDSFDCPELGANIGDACDDGDDSTENDVITEDCGCAGTPVVTFDCPELGANFGDACDDGDASTENDVITEDCECAGTPVASNDTDGDGVPDDEDNCPNTANPNQEDGNGDGIGDHCEDCDVPYMVEVSRISETSATFDAGNSVWHYQGTANRAGRPLRPYPMYGMDDMEVVHTQNDLIPVFEYDVWFRTICGDGTYSDWAGPFFLPTYEMGRSSNITLSPNPAVSVVTLSDVEARTIEVYNLNGSLIKTVNTNNNQMNVIDLPTGRYSLRVIDADGNAHYEQLIKR